MITSAHPQGWAGRSASRVAFAKITSILLFFHVTVVDASNTRCWRNKVGIDCPAGMSITYDVSMDNNAEKGDEIEWVYTVNLPSKLLAKGNYIAKHGNAHACRKNPQIDDEDTENLDRKCNPFISDVRLLEVNTAPESVNLLTSGQSSTYGGVSTYTYTYSSVHTGLKPGTYWAFSHVFFCSGSVGTNCTQGVRYDVQSKLHKVQVKMDNQKVLWFLVFVGSIIGTFAIAYCADPLFLIKLYKCSKGENEAWHMDGHHRARDDTGSGKGTIRWFQMEAKRITEQNDAVRRGIKDHRGIEEGDIVSIKKTKDGIKSAQHGQEAEVIQPIGWMKKGGKGVAQVKLITGDNVGEMKSYKRRELQILDKASDKTVSDILSWSIALKLHQADRWDVEEGFQVIVRSGQGKGELQRGEITSIEWQPLLFRSGGDLDAETDMISECTVRVIGASRNSLHAGGSEETKMDAGKEIQCEPTELGKLIFLSPTQYLDWWAEFRSRESEFYSLRETKAFAKETESWYDPNSDAAKMAPDCQFLVNTNFGNSYSFGKDDPLRYFERIEDWDEDVKEHEDEWRWLPPSLKLDLKKRCFHLKQLMKDAGVLGYKKGMLSKEEEAITQKIEDAGLQAPVDLFESDYELFKKWHDQFYLSVPKTAEDLYTVFEKLSQLKEEEKKRHEAKRFSSEVGVLSPQLNSFGDGGTFSARSQRKSMDYESLTWEQVRGEVLTDVFPMGTKVEVKRNGYPYSGVVMSVDMVDDKVLYDIAYDNGVEERGVDENLVEDPMSWEQTKRFYFRLSKGDKVNAKTLTMDGTKVRVSQDTRPGKITRIWVSGLTVSYDIRFLKAGNKHFPAEENDENMDRWYESAVERVDSLLVEVHQDGRNEEIAKRRVLRRLIPVVEIVLQLVNDEMVTKYPESITYKKIEEGYKMVKTCFLVSNVSPSAAPRRGSIVSANPGGAFRNAKKKKTRRSYIHSAGEEEVITKVDVTEEQADEDEKSDIVRVEMSRRAWDQRELLMPRAYADANHKEHDYFGSAASEEQVCLEVALMLHDFDARDGPETVELVSHFDLEREYMAIAAYMVKVMKQRRDVIHNLSKQQFEQKQDLWSSFKFLPTESTKTAVAPDKTSPQKVRIGALRQSIEQPQPSLKSKASFSGVGDVEESMLNLEEEIEMAYKILGADLGKGHKKRADQTNHKQTNRQKATKARELFKRFITCKEIHLQIAAIHTLSALQKRPFTRDWSIHELAKEGDRITIHIFRVLTSGWYNNLMICLVLAMMSLSFWEAPSGSQVDFHLTRSSTLVSIEFVFLLIFFLDFQSRRFVRGDDIYSQLADMFYITLIVFCFVDVIIVLCRAIACNPVDDCALKSIGSLDISALGIDFSRYPRISRPLRSLFLIRRVKFLQDYLKKVFIYGLVGVLPVVIIMTFFILVIVLFAHFNLKDCESLEDGDLNFKSPMNSFTAFFIILTAEPDIVAETYGECTDRRVHKICSGVVFMVFTIVVIFFMGLFLAEIRESYIIARQHQNWRDACVEAINLTAAFLMLDRNRDLRLDKVEWTEFVALIVPRWRNKEMEEHVSRKFYEADKNGDGTIQHREFVHLCEFLRDAVSGGEHSDWGFFHAINRSFSHFVQSITPRQLKFIAGLEHGDRVWVVLVEAMAALANFVLLYSVEWMPSKNVFVFPEEEDDPRQASYLFVDDVFAAILFAWSLLRLSRAKSPILFTDIVVTFLSGPLAWMLALANFETASMNFRLVRSLRAIYIWYHVSYTVIKRMKNHQSPRLMERSHPLVPTKNQLLDYMAHHIRDEKEVYGIVFDRFWHHFRNKYHHLREQYDFDEEAPAWKVGEQIQSVIGKYDFTEEELKDAWNDYLTEERKEALENSVQAGSNEQHAPIDLKDDFVKAMIGLTKERKKKLYPDWVPMSAHLYRTNKLAHYTASVLNFQVLFRCIGALSNVVKHMVALFLVIVYPYAIFGMENFAYQLVKCSDSDGVETKMEWEKCDEYGAKAFNFNTFGSSLFTLYNVFYTGELQDILIGTQRIEFNSASAYWITYYIFVTSILGDVLVSNIIEQLSVRKQLANNMEKQRSKDKTMFEQNDTPAKKRHRDSMFQSYSGSGSSMSSGSGGNWEDREDEENHHQARHHLDFVAEGEEDEEGSEGGEDDRTQQQQQHWGQPEDGGQGINRAETRDVEGAATPSTVTSRLSRSWADYHPRPTPTNTQEAPAVRTATL